MQVFLTYTHNDEAVADMIRAGLARCGFQVGSDEAARPGASIAELIASGLRAADAFVVLLGKDTAGRQWTSLEIGVALASGKLIVPVLIEKDAQVPALLRDRQYLDLTEPGTRAQRLEVLCEALRRPPGTQHAGKSRADLLERASDALRQETEAYTQDVAARERRAGRVQLIATVLSVAAAAIGLVVASSDSSAIVAALAAGLSALLASAIGFYFGSSANAREPSDHTGDPQ